MQSDDFCLIKRCLKIINKNRKVPVGWNEMRIRIRDIKNNWWHREEMFGREVHADLIAQRIGLDEYYDQPDIMGFKG